MAKSKKLAPWIMGDGPEPVPPNLTGEQKKQIAAIAEINFSKDDWDKIELARRDFTWCKWAKHQAIEYQLFVDRLKAIADAAQNLLTAVSGNKPDHSQEEEKRPTVNAAVKPPAPLDNTRPHSKRERKQLRKALMVKLPDLRNANSIKIDKMALLLWHELTDCESSLPSIFELMAICHLLERAARRALRRTEQWSEKDTWQHYWHGVINLLASIFEGHGVRPTAAKSSRAKNPELSLFVRFIWTVMETLPAEIREHVQSPVAMAKAVANSLAFRRSHNSAGPTTPGL